MLKVIIINRKFYEAVAAAMEVLMFVVACVLLLRAATSIV